MLANGRWDLIRRLKVNERHGRGKAWAWHAVCASAKNVPQSYHFGTQDFMVYRRTAHFITEVYIHLFHKVVFNTRIPLRKLLNYIKGFSVKAYEGTSGN